jgi:hypothetical protein
MHFACQFAGKSTHSYAPCFTFITKKLFAIFYSMNYFPAGHP